MALVTKKKTMRVPEINFSMVHPMQLLRCILLPHVLKVGLVNLK
jgi:hypothetical protein